MKFCRSLLFVSMLMAMVAGCVTRGEEFSSNMAWIRMNNTKQADVRRLLGEPQQVGSSSGIPTWTYGYYKFRLIGDSHTKELKLYWNADGSVKNYTFSSSFPGDRALAGAPTGAAPANHTMEH